MPRWKIRVTSNPGRDATDGELAELREQLEARAGVIEVDEVTQAAGQAFRPTFDVDAPNVTAAAATALSDLANAQQETSIWWSDAYVGRGSIHKAKFADVEILSVDARGG